MRKIDIKKNLWLLEQVKKGHLIIETVCCGKRANVRRCMNEIIVECPNCGEIVANICFVEPKGVQDAKL